MPYYTLLHFIAVNYPNFNEKVVIYVSDKEAVADYSSKLEELAKRYGYEAVLIQYTPDDRNVFTAGMLKSPVFLSTSEAERVYIKHMALVKSVATLFLLI